MIPISNIAMLLRNGKSVRQSKTESGLPITRIETIADGTIDPNRIGYAGLTKEDSAKWLLQPGDILISHINSRKHLGKCAIYQGTPPELIHGMNLLLLRCDTEVAFPGYVRRLLASINFRRSLLSITKDSVNQSSFNISSFKKLCIPLPSLAEQKRIAKTLEEADTVRAKRRESIALMDALVRSKFLEMFGDPVRNPKGWQTLPLEELCELIVDCPHSTPTYSDSPTGLLCIRSSDIQDGELVLDKARHVNQDVYNERILRHEPEAGEVIYTREGGRLGLAGLIPINKKVCLGQRMMLFKGSPDIALNTYIWGLLHCSVTYKTVLAMSGGGAAPRVNIKQLKKLIAICPPINDQRHFTTVVRSIQAQKELLQSHLSELDTLFASLQSRAFNGEL